MSDVIYPQVMGLFGSGYILHLVWRAWERRQARRMIVRWDLKQMNHSIEIVWNHWDVADAASGERGK